MGWPFKVLQFSSTTILIFHQQVFIRHLYIPGIVFNVEDIAVNRSSCSHRTYILMEKKRKREKMSLYTMLGSDKGYLENKEGEKD